MTTKNPYSITRMIINIKTFLALNPTDEQVYKFYDREILPFDKRSISEILEEEQ